MEAVIMAGGKGTRIAAVDMSVPKPMIKICDKPILQYQIECLERQNIRDIILVIGHLGSIIEDYFGDGKSFGVRIRYIKEDTPLGTAGALYYLRGLTEADFLLINGDIIWNIDIERFVNAHMQMGGLATIFTHPNDHPFDSGVIETDDSNAVIRWLNKEDERRWYKNRVNAGLHILSAKLLEKFYQPQKVDLDREILKPLIQERQLFAYDSPEYVKDMGTPERYYEVVNDLQTGIVEKRSLASKQKAVFLDRDGTINKYVGFLTNIADMELIDGAAEAVKLINRSGYLAIVVTNQPVIARGGVTLNELQEIHNKFETLLGLKGAYIDDLLFCPHHPDKGFDGEIPEYKIDCMCRKPKPGMLLESAGKYNIDIEQSWMIGDSQSDIDAGMNAGCRVAGIGSKITAQGIPVFDNLLECINYILNNS